MPAYSWVVDAIHDGAEIVTANRRLSRALRNAYDEAQLSLGRKAWETPRIFSWNVWLNALFDSIDVAVGVPLRLSAHASDILWERLLSAAADERTLGLKRLVREVRQTWQRLQEWSVPLDEIRRHAGNDDERLFAAAASRYADELKANAWIDGALLAHFVAERVKHSDLKLPARLVHAGFDRLTPAAETLMRALREKGCNVSAAPLSGHRSVPVVVSAADGDAELRTAGSWTRERLTANATARVAIVYPPLQQNAPRAARLVREGAAPGWQHGGPRHDTAVNVSYGRRLSEYPLIAVALLWLEWLHRGLSSRNVSVLLRSPRTGAGATDDLSRLERALRRLPDRHWSAASLASALRDREHGAEAAGWLAAVDCIAAAPFTAADQDSPPAWAGKIDSVLQELGWPGARPLDSSEFQLVNRWRELLNEFSRIAVVRPRLSFVEAVARVSALATETVYQPESPAGAVQLLGTLEAAGLEFDHIWVGNLHSLQWPPPAQPLSLVSRALQQKHNMPDATPSDTLEFAERTLARLSGSAPSVVLSWPRADRDATLSPSPLLAPSNGESSIVFPMVFPMVLPIVFPDPGWYAAALCRHGTIARVLDDAVPRVQAGERVHGGAYTVQRQLDEPLSAFAYGRLGVGDLDRFETGLSASTRGIIVHTALHRLLRDKPASADLREWSGNELGARIDSSIDVALAPHERHADGILRRLIALERRRLRTLLRKFVCEEIKRPDFSVASVETDLQFRLHGVELGLRVDRIDRLQDGTLLILDYKTGAAKNLLNRDGNPVEIQLVVYASAVDGEVGGLALVNVDTRGILYKGTGASVPWNSVERDVWRERLRAWKAVVSEAIAGFAAGDVRVDTARTTEQSRRLSVLSRIEELKRGR